MHGKAQLEPTRHSVVLDCQVVPLHKTCQSLSAVCYIVHAVRLAMSPNSQYENLWGGQKLANRSQQFLDLSLSNLRTCKGVSVD